MVVHHGLILVVSLGLLHHLCFIYFPLLSDPLSFSRNKMLQQETDYAPHMLDSDRRTNFRLLGQRELVQSFLSDYAIALSDLDVDVALNARNKVSNKFRLLSESFVRRHRLLDKNRERPET
jgi:hypothetical protein